MTRETHRTYLAENQPNRYAGYVSNTVRVGGDGNLYFVMLAQSEDTFVSRHVTLGDGISEEIKSRIQPNEPIVVFGETLVVRKIEKTRSGNYNHRKHAIAREIVFPEDTFAGK